MTYSRLKDTNMFKIKGWKEIYHANTQQKGARVAMLASNKIDYKAKICNRDLKKRSHTCTGLYACPSCARTQERPLSAHL